MQEIVMRARELFGGNERGKANQTEKAIEGTRKYSKEQAKPLYKAVGAKIRKI